MRSSLPSRLCAAVVLAGALTLAGCAADPASTPPAQSSGATASELSGDLTVYAAASLKTGFDELATAFGAAHPGATVTPIVYDGSSTLATQIIEGAEVDVFASADENNMQKVVDAGLAAAPEVFATNVLILVVPKGNPGDVAGIGDLTRPELTVVLCAAEVPCGAASSTLLEGGGITAAVDSYEQNVTAVLAKVAAGEADAGLVYVTDAALSPEVETVETAGADAVVNRYPIVALDGAGASRVAEAFVEYVQSHEGRAVLAALGFGAP